MASARLARPLGRRHGGPQALGLHLEARPFAGRRLCGRRRVARGPLELDGRRRVVRADGLELGPERRRQGGCRFAPKRDPLAARAQPVERGGGLLAYPGGVGQLFLRALALRDQSGDLGIQRAALTGGHFAPRLGCAAPLGELRQVERRDRGLQARDLDAELGCALGRGGLQGKRAEALAHLVLEIAGALDLHTDPRELQLRSMPAALEAAEPGRLLDQLSALLRLGVEHGLDPPLRDDRAQAAAEPDVGQQLDQVDPPDRCAVDEVLAFPAPLQAPRHRHLGERQVGPRAVSVVEEQVDLARVCRLPARRAGEEDVVGLLSAQLPRAHRPGRPEDRVGDVRLA